MKSQNDVEIADQLSRRRAIGIAFAAIAFLAIQLVARPVFRADGFAEAGPRSYMWAINAAVLLLLLLPFGPYIRGPRVRALVHDEVSRNNSRAATTAGFWL